MGSAAWAVVAASSNTIDQLGTVPETGRGLDNSRAIVPLAAALPADHARPFLSLVPPRQIAGSPLPSFSEAVHQSPTLLGHRVVVDVDAKVIQADEHFHSQRTRGDTDLVGTVTFIDGSTRYMDGRTTVLSPWRGLADLMSFVGEAKQAVRRLTGIGADRESQFEPAYVSTTAFSGLHTEPRSKEETVGYTLWMQAPIGAGNEFAALTCLPKTRSQASRLHDCAIESLMSGGAVSEVQAAVVTLARRLDVPVYSL